MSFSQYLLYCQSLPKTIIIDKETQIMQQNIFAFNLKIHIKVICKCLSVLSCSEQTREIIYIKQFHV